MICYSLSSAILWLLILQRGYIQLVFHSRSANIKSITVWTDFLLLTSLQLTYRAETLLLFRIYRSFLRLIWFSLSLIFFCSRNSDWHVTRHCLYPRRRYMLPTELNEASWQQNQLQQNQVLSHHWKVQWHSQRSQLQPKLQFFMQTSLVPSLQLIMSRGLLWWVAAAGAGTLSVVRTWRSDYSVLQHHLFSGSQTVPRTSRRAPKPSGNWWL